MTWHAVNAYTSRHQDDYLLEVVRGWTERLAGEHRMYFVRYWQDGPHVTVRVEAPTARFRDEIGPSLVREASEWLQARDPETQAVDESLLRERAALDTQEDTQEELLRGGTVVAVEDAPGHVGPLKGPGATRLHEDYLVDSHGHALAGVELTATHGRLPVAFDALVTAPDGLFGDITASLLSYRLSADAFLMSQRDPEVTREFFERSYRERREALRERLRLLLENGDDRLARWGRDANPRLRDFRDRAARALEAGQLEPLPSERIPPSLEQERLRHSPLHEAAQRTGLGEALQAMRAWQTFRVALVYLYTDLIRVGLTGIERFMACHLVSRAIEDELGLDATAQLERYARGDSPAPNARS